VAKTPTKQTRGDWEKGVTARKKKKKIRSEKGKIPQSDHKGDRGLEGMVQEGWSKSTTKTRRKEKKYYRKRGGGGHRGKTNSL